MTKRKILPPLEELEAHLSYCPESGVITRRSSHLRPDLVGKSAGTVTSKGYLHIWIGRTCYLGHRIAFKMATGLEPPEEIDHRDGDPLNNRLSNLRVAEGRSDNMASQKIRPQNNSGIIGVSLRPGRKRWVARIKHKGTEYQASFPTKEEAIAWRLEKEVELHGEFAQHRRNKPEQEEKPCQ